MSANTASPQRRSEHRFNRVIIVESLPDKLKTGKNLKEDVFDKFEADHPDVDFKAEYRPVHSRAEFEALLKQITEEAERDGTRPILHLEMHGLEDQSGVEFAKPGDEMTWAEMTPYLTAINVASRNNLFVVLAVCFGAAMAEILHKPHDRAPVFGMVGHTDSITPKHFARAFREFYKEILNQGDGDQALMDLNVEGAEDDPNVEYRLRTAEGAFRDLMRPIVKKFTVGKAKQEQTENLVTKTMQKWGDVVDLKAARQMAKRVQRSAMDKSFMRMRDRFLMLDLYPEERERFTLAYDDVATVPLVKSPMGGAGDSAL